MRRIAIPVGAALLGAALKVLLDVNTAFVVLAVGLVFIAWGALTEFGSEPKHGLSITPSPTELPEDRPRVSANYGLSPTSMMVEGLQLVNEGHSAYDVQAAPIELGDGWTLHFDDMLERLVDQGFLSGSVSKGESRQSLDDVWLALKKKSAIAEFLPLTIRYRDFGGRWYRTKCELHRDPTNHYPAFYLRFVKQVSDGLGL